MFFAYQSGRFHYVFVYDYTIATILHYFTIQVCNLEEIRKALQEILLSMQTNETYSNKSTA